jgi:hypothetical protein
MNGLPAPEAPTELDAALVQVFQSPPPDPIFVARLEQQLLAQPVSRPVWPWRLRSRRQNWAMAGLGLALALAVALALIGPAHVLAEFQRFFSFVPGIGFVDLEATRVLTTPVQVTRDGVTLRVAQVLAQPDRTILLIRTEGLPPEDQLWPSGIRSQAISATLQLPNGTTLPLQAFTLSLASSRLEFAPLPVTATAATLELPRLPVVPPDTAPEGWAIPFQLRLANGGADNATYPQPYTPANGSDTHHDITISVLSVAHSTEETALRLQVSWPDPTWTDPRLSASGIMKLQDDLGHIYFTPPPSNNGSSVSSVVISEPSGPGPTLTPIGARPSFVFDENFNRFTPISGAAQQLSLRFDDVSFDVPATGTFTLDLGAAPKIGDEWPLDVWLTAFDQPVHLVGARLRQDQYANSPPVTVLDFDMALAAANGGVSIRGLSLQSDARFNGGSGSYSFQTGRVSAGLSVVAGQPLPSGVVKVTLANASIWFDGPWQISWAVPGHSGPAVAPVTLHPSAARQTHFGLTAAVTEVTLTDRLTAVTTGLVDPPAGTHFSQVLGWVPEREGRDYYLEDNWGRRYGYSYVGWQTLTPLASDRVLFEPAQPLAQSMTLHAPAIEVAVDGPAEFDVTVPATATVAPSSNGPALSGLWPVDIPLMVAGHALHFEQAGVVEANSTHLLSLVAMLPADLSHPWLTGLALAAVTDPSGRPVGLGSSLSGSSVDPSGRRLALTLNFSIAEPDRMVLQAGRYHVALRGLTEAIPGPWSFTWNLDQP